MLCGIGCGGWMGGLLQGAPDRYRAELELLARDDLHVCEWSARALLQLEPGRREELAGWLEEFDIHALTGIGFDYFAQDADQRKRAMDGVMEALETLPRVMRTPMCYRLHTGRPLSQAAAGRCEGCTRALMTRTPGPTVCPLASR